MIQFIIILLLVIAVPFVWYFLAHLWATASKDVWMRAIHQLLENLKKEQKNGKEKEK